MGIVYLLCDNYANAYKIGVTKKKVEARLKQLKTGNSNDIFILNSFESKYYKIIERRLHKIYKVYQINREWFELPDDAVFDFIKTCQQIEDNHIFLLENNEFYK